MNNLWGELFYLLILFTEWCKKSERHDRWERHSNNTAWHKQKQKGCIFYFHAKETSKISQKIKAHLQFFKLETKTYEKKQQL